MASTSDKARFYLEQSIPDLQELARKKIFSKDEIARIASKRSDFEHKINACGPKLADFTRYVEFEVNVEALRCRRARRLGVKGGAYLIQKRVFFIYNRATRKFPGELSLWQQYLEYAKKQQAYKIITEITTKIVRLHPSKAEVWIFAAQQAFDDNGDVTEARSYMQRGLRFCKESKELWLAYARLELTYLSKLARRRKILGLDQEQVAAIEEGNDPSADMITLPKLTSKDFDPPASSEPDPQTTQSVTNTTLAMQGAIPIAIFDAAQQRFKDISLADRFFDIAQEFTGMPAAKKFAQHIVTQMRLMEKNNAITLDCLVREPLIASNSASSEFATGLRGSVAAFKSVAKEAPSLIFALRTLSWALSYLRQEVDSNIRTVLTAVVKSALDMYKSVHETSNSGSADDFAEILRETGAAGAREIIPAPLAWARAIWQDNKPLRVLSEAIDLDDVAV